MTEQQIPEVADQVDTTDTTEDVVEQPEQETFPRSYVEKLRKEAGDARVKAQRADDLAHRLHKALVAANGRLADPDDLTFDEAHLEDQEALQSAVDDLLARKPHLASRTPRGDIGQGATAPSTTIDLAALLRSGAN